MCTTGRRTNSVQGEGGVEFLQSFLKDGLAFEASASWVSCRISLWVVLLQVEFRTNPTRTLGPSSTTTTAAASTTSSDPWETQSMSMSMHQEVPLPIKYSSHPWPSRARHTSSLL